MRHQWKAAGLAIGRTGDTAVPEATAPGMCGEGAAVPGESGKTAWAAGQGDGSGAVWSKGQMNVNYRFTEKYGKKACQPETKLSAIA
jgi:hypothetical protein